MSAKVECGMRSSGSSDVCAWSSTFSTPPGNSYFAPGWTCGQGRRHAEKLGLDVLVIPQRDGIARMDDLAFRHHVSVVSDFHRKRRILLRQQDRCPLALEP